MKTEVAPSPAGGRVRPFIWLIVGCIFLFLSQMRWGIGPLAWIAPVPLLRYLRLTSGFKTRLLFCLALFATYILTIVKILSGGPLPVMAAPQFAAVPALAMILACLAWDTVRRRTRSTWVTLVFPAMSVITQWAQYRFTPLGSWGAPVYTQLHDLALLQLASLTGIAGIGFLMGWVAALIEEVWSGGRLRPYKWQASALVLSLLATYGFGVARLAQKSDGPQVRVAAVATDSRMYFPPGAGDDQTLWRRTENAARMGARLVVWNEAATVVSPEREAAFIAQGRNLARKRRIHLVLAYALTITLKPPPFANKYVWLGPDGGVRQQYLKHNPVPGEPCRRGTRPPRGIKSQWGLWAGAICYDYDFPHMGLKHARLGVGLVALPSSDWRGIDPYHTRMAALRAIEGGFSLIRSTRAGLSAAFDSRGRTRAIMDYFEPGDRIMIAAVPARHVPTVYASIGDLFTYLCLAGLLIGVISLAISARRKRPQDRSTHLTD
jgi:apolipoprotein N-acyltransferase